MELNLTVCRMEAGKHVESAVDVAPVLIRSKAAIGEDSKEQEIGRFSKCLAVVALLRTETLTR